MTRPSTPAAALAEVVVSLGGTILDVRHVGRGAGGAAPWSPWLPRYTLGEGPEVHLPVALAGCDADGSFTLVEAVAAGIRVRLAAAMTGEVVRGAETLAVAGLLARGEAALVLVPGDRATLRLAALELAIRVEAATPVQRFRAQIDRPLWLAQAGALALFAVAMTVVQRVEPVSEAPQFDDPDVQATLIRYFKPADAAAPAPTSEPVDGQVASTTVAARPEPPAVAPAPTPVPAAEPVVTGPLGQGASDLAKRSGIFSVADFMAALEEGKAAARESMARYLPSAGDTAAWTAVAARDPMRHLAGGLGLAQTVRGGGGAGVGVVDIDIMQLLFGKTGADGKRRYGGARRAARERFAERDAVQPERRTSVAWTASVGRDLIRGVVNRNKPEVRQCFRDGMAKNPDLKGQVEVAFTIQADGTVAYPSVARSTVADREVEACVTATVKRWKFPTFVASGGDVDVRFPFTVGAA